MNDLVHDTHQKKLSLEVHNEATLASAPEIQPVHQRYSVQTTKRIIFAILMLLPDFPPLDDLALRFARLLPAQAKIYLTLAMEVAASKP